MKYICELCGMVYDEQIGDIKHDVPAGTAFAELPESYECSVCGAKKEAFTKAEQASAGFPEGNDREFWLSAKYAEDYQESKR